MGEASEAPKVHSSAVGAPTRNIHPRNHFRNASSPTQHRWRQPEERQPLLRQRSLGPLGEEGDVHDAQPVAGGTVLGIHNLAIVMPQFIVCPFTSLKYDSPIHTHLKGCNCRERDLQDRGHRGGPEQSQYVLGQERCWLGPSLRWSMHIGTSEQTFFDP